MDIAASIVALIVTVAYKGSILAQTVAEPEAVDQMWRILIGLGCVPGVIALYYRLTIPETPRFTMDIERNVARASDDIKNVLTTGTFVDDPDAIIERVDAPKASTADFVTFFGKWKNGKILFATAYCWFALDIAFYGLSLNSSIILQAIGFGTPPTKGTPQGIYDNLNNISVGNIILAVGGLVPGYWVSFLFIDSWGRKPIQILGFTMLTILFIIMGKLLFAEARQTLTITNRFRLRDTYCERRQQESVRVPLLPLELLPEFRTQHYHLYHPRRDFPYPLQIYRSRLLCCVR